MRTLAHGCHAMVVGNCELRRAVAGAWRLCDARDQRPIRPNASSTRANRASNHCFGAACVNT